MIKTALVAIRKPRKREDRGRAVLNARLPPGPLYLLLFYFSYIRGRQRDMMKDQKARGIVVGN